MTFKPGLPIGADNAMPIEILGVNMTYRPGLPVTSDNPYPVKIVTGAGAYKPGLDVTDTNPLPMANIGGTAGFSPDKTTYPADVPAGTLIATLADPFGSGSTFSVVGSAPATLALASGGRIVAGAGAQTAGQSATIVIRAAKAGRAIEEPLTFTAQADGVVPPPPPSATVLNLASFGVTDYTPSLTVRRISAGSFDVVETAEGLRPSRTGTVKTLYMNPVAGSSANSGDTASAAKQVMNNCISSTLADTIRVRVVAPPKRILWGSTGWGTTQPAGKNIEIVADDDGELIFARTVASTAPVITANGDGTYTMSSGIASTSATHFSPVMDFSPTTRVLNGPARPPSAYVHTQGTADPASMRAGLGQGQSYRATNLGGSNDIVFRPLGDRELSTFDGYLVPTCQAGSSLLFRTPAAATTSFTVWSKNIHWAGGTVGDQNLQSGPGLRMRIVMTGGGIWGATAGNGLGPQGGTDVYLFDMGAGYCFNDALNTHSNASGDTYGRFIRIKVYFTGIGLGVSENAGTGHDGPAGTPTPVGPLGSRDIYVDCELAGSYGSTVGYVGSARAALFGCRIAASARPTGNNATAHTGEEARISLVECTLTGTSQGAFELSSAGAQAPINCYGMTQGSLRANGGVNFLPMPA